MGKKSLMVLLIATAVAVMSGCSVGQEPAATPTPTKTLVPTFTATPTIVLSPTDTPPPTNTPTATMPPEAPTPTDTATPTLGPPTNTPTPRPPAPTPTPRPPTPTNTPQPVYEYRLVQEPTKDPCHPGFCIPEVSGMVVDAQQNPIDNLNAVWLKLESETFGVDWCRTGDLVKMLQPGRFKFVSPDGQVFREYKLTVFESQGGRQLSPTYDLKMNAYTKAQQWNIIFQRTY